MGFPLFKVSKSTFDEPAKDIITPLPNPNPSNYRVVKTKQIQQYLIIKLNYPDCKNYEGNKIMVFECSLEDLIKQKKIDPHFSDNKNFLSPIARFEPTDEGWDNAVAFVLNCLLRLLD